jgi:hypothetical protein
VCLCVFVLIRKRECVCVHVITGVDIGPVTNPVCVCVCVFVCVCVCVITGVGVEAVANPVCVCVCVCVCNHQD